MRRRWLRASMLASAAALAATGLVVPAASADTHDQIRSAQQRLAALDRQAEVFAERMNAARDRYVAATQRATLAQRAAASAEARLGLARTKLSAFAAEAYRSGGMFGTDSVLGADSDPASLLDKLSLLDAVSRSQAQTMADFAAAQHDATQATATARGAVAVANAELSKVKDARTRILADAATVQALLRQLHRTAAAQAAAAAAAALSNQSDLPPPSAVGHGGAHAAQIAVQWAYRELGKPYVWGAAGPDSFDCSGLTQYIYGKAGIYLPHYTGDQWNSGRHVSRSDLRPGDLIFYFSDLSHEAVYIGGGRVIHAPHTGDVVRIANLDMDPYAGAVRVAG